MVPSIGKQQRCNNTVQQGFVVKPLVHSALSHWQPGVDRGQVRRRGGRELRGQLFDFAVLCQPLQERRTPEFLEKAPTESVYQE